MNTVALRSLSKVDVLRWAVLIAVAIVLGFLFSAGLGRIVNAWEQEEYSHGYLIPFIAGYLVWQKRAVLAVEPVKGSWLGVLVLAFGLFLYPLGELSTLYVLLQYGLILSFTGFVYAAMGWRVFRHIWVALFLLFFTVPLPDFVYKSLSSELQLISSQIGVWFIRLFDISVLLEGNVIDLGAMQLQVVEACSGLRYLFPLATLAFIVAVFFRGAWWKRALIFISSLPITVLMNSFRIGAIGVLVEYWGKDMAEGFLHDFEGWVVFMAAFAALLAEVWLFAFFSRPRMQLHQMLNFEDALPPSSGVGAGIPRAERGWITPPVVASIALLAGMLTLSIYLPNREDVVPEREFFADFPVSYGDWQGKQEKMEQRYVDVLQFDDYLLMDYARAESTPINLYIAYYDAQNKDVASHSPRACLPGGGWQIDSFGPHEIDAVYPDGKPLRLNRVVMSMGTQRSVVYYWFQQRGRVITNEYLVKWYLFWDALTRNRTDGALVRLTMPISTTLSVAEADQRLAEFTRLIAKDLPRFIPD